MPEDSHAALTPPRGRKHPKDMVSASANNSCRAKGISVTVLTLLHKRDKLVIKEENIPGSIEMFQTFSETAVFWKKENLRRKTKWYLPFIIVL